MTHDTSHDLKKTPLYDAHVAAGARMVAFGGWLMPVQYTGITEEHVAVRTRAGLFDISHMGQVEVRGVSATAFLDHLLPNHVGALRPGGILYTPMCNEAGGIIDDLLVYRQDERDYLLIVNASRKDADLAWIEAQAGGGVSVADASDRYAMVAPQGPDAEAILSRHADADLSALEYYHFITARIAGTESLISRTGYTGEDGFEVLCPWAEGPKVWDLLLQEADGKRAVPAGLGARDTLRLEAGYALYGSDLSEETAPLEARLGWTVRFDKPGDFVGRAALLRQQEAGVPRRLAGLRMTERAIPRSHQRILSADGGAIGEITSGTFSPTLRAGIALGYVWRRFGKSGTPLSVEIRTDRKAAEVVKLPFVESRVKQNR